MLSSGGAVPPSTAFSSDRLTEMATMRINRALALAGVASRRGAEQLVAAGRVSLNGTVVTSLAAQVDPLRDALLLDGKRLKLQQPVYFLYHKPRGILSTMHDEQGRECLGGVAGELPGNPRPVGRLDRASEGLLLLTNDGEVALRLAHPRYGVQKEYQVTVSPRLTDADARRMVDGVVLEDGPARFVGIELAGQEPDRSRLNVTVQEGRNRLIRRVCEALEYRVLRLKRVKLGVLVLGRLEPGKTRQLSNAEAENLRRSVGLGRPAPVARTQRSGADRPAARAAQKGPVPTEERPRPADRKPARPPRRP
jgi:pseudouridine synthase